MPLKTFDDFIFAEKPSGFNIHQSERVHRSFVEFLESKNKEKYYSASSLGQGTSGAIVLCKSPESAKLLTELFSEKKVQTTYIFLTDRQSLKNKFHTQSFIKKQRGKFISSAQKPFNAETEFEYVAEVGPYFLWRALPLSGQAHQVRLHAESLGLPILGDREHGGSPFYRLCLHCQNLKFKWESQEVSYHAQDPVWSQWKYPLEWIYEEALEKRKLFFESLEDLHSYRLIHREGLDIKLDIFGPQAWAYRYIDSEMLKAEKKFWSELSLRLQKPILVKTMSNRGKNPLAGDTEIFGDFKPIWTAQELDTKYEFRSDSGQSPGLFLDQRQNRQWVKSQAQGKSLLNLFCYTGGFSVMAALGGATTTCSVDVSRNFLDWTKRNFQLNDLPIEGHEFWDSDVLFFLKAALKKKRQWDIVVCDPPTFGRSKSGVFKLSSQWEELLEACQRVLKPGGKILFSTNYESWTSHELFTKIKESKKLKALKIASAPGPGLDFEVSEDPLLKSFILSS